MSVSACGSRGGGLGAGWTRRRHLAMVAVMPVCLWARFGEAHAAAAAPPSATSATPCAVLADGRTEEPVTSIIEEYNRRTGSKVVAHFLPAAELNGQLNGRKAACDVVVCMAAKDETTVVAELPGAKKVAWKHPGGHPVWAAAVTKHAEATDVFRFLGGPTGHRLWSESKAGFTITTGKTHAEAFEWVVENRIKHTYLMTAMRMLREIGGIREGICIDVGCGTGNLDIELAKRSKFKIIGLDIDPDMQPLFEKRVREAEKRINEAKLSDRITCKVGTLVDLPFDEGSFDLVAGVGPVLIWDHRENKMQEIYRVLRPGGAALVGGKYLYMPESRKVSSETLRAAAARTSIPWIRISDDMGQWVEIRKGTKDRGFRD